MSRSALVIVPTYNERGNLPTLVAGLMRIPNVRVMVVDDQSPDGTGALADELAREYEGRVSVMHRTGRRGLGRSYIDGIKQAITERVDVIGQMDADLSHDPAHLPDLIAATERADVVIGSRYIPGGAIVNWPKRRQLLSRFANVYVRLITRLGARDCTSGYRCWRREALAALPLERFISDGYSFLVEMLFVASRRGNRIAEVPITFVERRVGESKISKGVLLESAIMPWRLIGNPDTAQKARWLHGIAFQGWERLGWWGRPVDLWMELRDRRGLNDAQKARVDNSGVLTASTPRCCRASPSTRGTSSCKTSCRISALNRCLITREGALPGRKPGRRASLATSPLTSRWAASTSPASRLTTSCLRVAEAAVTWTFTTECGGWL